MVFNKYTSWTLAMLLQSSAFGLGCGVVVCCLHKGDNKVFDCCEKLCIVSLWPYQFEGVNSYVVYFVCTVQTLVLGCRWS